MGVSTNAPIDKVRCQRVTVSVRVAIESGAAVHAVIVGRAGAWSFHRSVVNRHCGVASHVSLRITSNHEKVMLVGLVWQKKKSELPSCFELSDHVDIQTAATGESKRQEGRDGRPRWDGRKSLKHRVLNAVRRRPVVGGGSEGQLYPRETHGLPSDRERGYDRRGCVG